MLAILFKLRLGYDNDMTKSAQQKPLSSFYIHFPSLSHYFIQDKETMQARHFT